MTVSSEQSEPLARVLLYRSIDGWVDQVSLFWAARIASLLARSAACAAKLMMSPSGLALSRFSLANWRGRRQNPKNSQKLLS